MRVAKDKMLIGEEGVGPGYIEICFAYLHSVIPSNRPQTELLTILQADTFGVPGIVTQTSFAYGLFGFHTDCKVRSSDHSIARPYPLLTYCHFSFSLFSFSLFSFFSIFFFRYFLFSLSSFSLPFFSLYPPCSLPSFFATLLSLYPPCSLPFFLSTLLALYPFSYPRRASFLIKGSFLFCTAFRFI